MMHVNKQDLFLLSILYQNWTTASTYEQPLKCLLFLGFWVARSSEASYLLCPSILTRIHFSLGNAFTLKLDVLNSFPVLWTKSEVWVWKYKIQRVFFQVRPTYNMHYKGMVSGRHKCVSYKPFPFPLHTAWIWIWMAKRRGATSDNRLIFKRYMTIRI